MDTQFSANEQHQTLYCLEIGKDFRNKARDTSILEFNFCEKMSNLRETGCVSVLSNFHLLE